MSETTVDFAVRTIHHPIQQDSVTFLETCAESGNRHTHVEVLLAPGGGVDLHYHKTYAEKFRCLEGSLGVEVGGVLLHLAPGETATVEAGELHRFFNVTDQPCRFECFIEPGCRGFEEALQIGYGLARDGHADRKGRPKDLRTIAWLLVLSETELTGWYAVLAKGLHWLGRRPASQRLGQKLRARYVRL